MMALPSAVFESTSKVLSVISTKLEDKASRADTIARIEIAVRRIRVVVEKTGKTAITYVSLLDSWNFLKLKCMEGMALLNKYKPRQELDGQVMVRSSSFLHRFAKRAANLSFSLLVGLANEQLSPSVAQIFERYADWAEKSFVAEVESCCPLRHDTFRYPFLQQIFQGKSLFYETMNGRKEIRFAIWPVILEGRGVEALLAYSYFDPERVEKSFRTSLMLRISESTDIVGAAIKCLRSASLLSPVAQDAAAQLTQLHYFQDLADSYEPTMVEFQELFLGVSKIFRSDPLCCQAASGHEPSINSIISSELSQIFPEQTIIFDFVYIVPMKECRLGTASNKTHSNTMVGKRSGKQPLVITYAFAPHLLSPCILEANCTINMMVTKKEGCEDESKPGNSSNIKKNIDMARRLIDSLIDEPEATKCEVQWTTKHGAVWLMVEKPRKDEVSAPKARHRYNTRSAKKRKM